MMKLLKRLSLTTILAACSVVMASCDNTWSPPTSWTLRPDGIFRRKLSDDECKKANKPIGCKEELNLEQFMEMIKAQEGKSFAIVVTPAGEKSIADEIDHLRQDLEACNAR